MRVLHRLILWPIVALACLAAAPAGIAADSSASRPPALTPKHAAVVFQQAHHDCMADHGKLWGVSLCGPMLLVDPASHRIITNEADAEGKLKQVLPGVFAGRLSPDQPVANTSVEWAGIRWTQVLWPLPKNAAARRTLLAHESFHRIQNQVAPIHRVGDNAQLDTLYGRYTMQLEWRALDAALAAKDDDAAHRHVADALLFRAARYRHFPTAQASEVALERNEGLAEYTGVMVGNSTPARRLAMARRDLTAHLDDPSFVRSFAYATGPAYGLLLDRFAPGWRRHIGGGKGPAATLADALDLHLAHMPVATLTERASHYGGPALLASETARKQRRDREIARYRARLVNGPVLVLPLDHMQVQFDPRTLLPLGDAGTVYPKIRVSDDWGSIEVTGGALMAPDWKQLTVAAPTKGTGGSTLHGDGWTLHLAPRWQLEPGHEPGDFRLYRTGP